MVLTKIEKYESTLERLNHAMHEVIMEPYIGYDYEELTQYFSGSWR